EEVVSAYGKAKYGEEHPLRYRYFGNAARLEHGDVRPKQLEWILLKNSDVLEGSHNKTYVQQETALVDALSTNTSIHYEIPTLLDAVTAAFFREIARPGSFMFSAGNERNRFTYTRVQETTQRWHLA